MFDTLNSDSKHEQTIIVVLSWESSTMDFQKLLNQPNTEFLLKSKGLQCKGLILDLRPSSLALTLLLYKYMRHVTVTL